MAIDPSNPVPPQYVRIAGVDNIPDHVPRELVRTTGITFSADFLASPFEFMADLHKTMPPIYYEVNRYMNAW